MKIFLQAAAIAAAIFLSLNLAACGSSKSADSSPATEIVKKEPVAEPLTEADFVVDGLTLGMSKSDVDKKLGKGEPGKLVNIYTYGDYTMIFTPDGKLCNFVFIVDNIRTARKVSVGSTLAALERIYGTNYRRDDDNENTFIAVYSLGNLELRFFIVKKTSKVMSIELRDTNLYVPPKPKSKTPAPLSDSDFVIGNLRFGMTPADVERKLGKATNIRDGEWYEFGKNIGAHFRNGVSDIFATQGNNSGTPRKIFVGSTFSEVEKAYGDGYRRDETGGKDFTISYTLGEKLLTFFIDGNTNRVTTIMAIEDINNFSMPSENSKPAANSKPQSKPQQPREQPRPKVDNRAAAEQVLSDFTNAYLNRDRAGMESCSFYEERNFTREKGYDLLETQMQVFDTVNQVYSGTFGNSWQYTYEIFSMDKINADTYKCEVVMIMGTDTLRYPNIRVCNVGGRWLVDADSFAYSASLSFTNAIYSGY